MSNNESTTVKELEDAILELRDLKAHEDAFINVLVKSKVEFRFDKQCQTTGNLFLEFEKDGEPSGIAVTKADWWAFEYDEGCWIIIPTTRIRALSRRAFKERKVRYGGKEKKSRGVIVPIEWLIGRGAFEKGLGVAT